MKLVSKIVGILLLLLSPVFSIIFASAGFVISGNNSIFVAKNEDSYNPATKIWFIPPEDDTYGRVYFGFDKSDPLSAMNDAGLVMERFVGPESDSRLMPTDSLGEINYDRIMSTSATVTDVISWFDLTSREQLGNEVVLFADQSNQAILVKKDAVIFKDQQVMMHTSPPDLQSGSGDQLDWRAAKVKDLLSDTNAVNVEQCRTALAAISQDMTQYSTIYEIRNGSFNLHHFHQFDNHLQFDLAEELKAGPRQLEIPAMFPDNPEFQYIYQTRLTPQNNIFILLLLFVTSLIYAFTIVAWFSGWLIRRQDARDYGRAVVDPGPGPVAWTARITASLACGLGLLFLLATYSFPQLYQFSWPTYIYPWSLLSLLAYFPLAMLLLIGPILIFAVVAWLKSYWKLLSRWHYSLIAIILGINVALFFYWDLIRMI